MKSLFRKKKDLSKSEIKESKLGHGAASDEKPKEPESDAQSKALAPKIDVSKIEGPHFEPRFDSYFDKDHGDINKAMEYLAAKALSNSSEHAASAEALEKGIAKKDELPLQSQAGTEPATRKAKMEEGAGEVDLHDRRRSRHGRQGGLLHVRRRTHSATGAIVLSGLTVMFIALSYLTGSILFQFDSVVSFLAALVLLFRDTSHTVQARVVNRVLTSSHQLIADLSDYGLGGSSFLYVPEGRKVRDVMLVPLIGNEVAAPDSPAGKGEAGIPATSGSANSQGSLEGVSGFKPADYTSGKSEDLKEAQNDDGGSSTAETRGTPGRKKATIATSNLKFAPPGRAMAELFLRESALKDPSMDDIVSAIPETLVRGFQLATSSSVIVKSSGDEAVEVTLVHPVLTSTCGPPKAVGTGIVGCEICSMLAVLFSSSTSRLVSLDGCAHDEGNDISTTSLHLGAKYPAD